MKKIAGSLKISLAQYRELESFAQFASDLDADTRKDLDRGVRMIELLKQGINRPLSFAKQACLIFAGTNGHLDDVIVKDIAAFERELCNRLDEEKTVLADLIEKKDWDDTIRERLTKVITQTKIMFKTKA
jgi:F-type H+-transporting ATPase subunit alpha